jgi:hypothetical protein
MHFLMDSERWEAKAVRMAQRPSRSRACGAFILASLALTAAFAPVAQGQITISDPYWQYSQRERARNKAEWELAVSELLGRKEQLNKQSEARADPRAMSFLLFITWIVACCTSIEKPVMLNSKKDDSGCYLYEVEPGKMGVPSSV